MKWWVYKCNSTGRARADVRGDWNKHFDWWKDEYSWGQTEFLRDLKQLRIGDRVIAQQSNQNEIVGVLEVTRITPAGTVFLAPLIRFAGVDLRKLKQRHPTISRMPAFAQGRIQTLYPMTAADAKMVLRVCAVGMVRDDVERLFQKKSLWRRIGPLRLPNPRWQLGNAANSWAERLGLPPGAVKILRPSGQSARRDKSLGALQKEWNRNA
jgi:hypothetical protein